MLRLPVERDATRAFVTEDVLVLNSAVCLECEWSAYILCHHPWWGLILDQSLAHHVQTPLQLLMNICYSPLLSVTLLLLSFCNLFNPDCARPASVFIFYRCLSESIHKKEAKHCTNLCCLADNKADPTPPLFANRVGLHAVCRTGMTCN